MKPWNDIRDSRRALSLHENGKGVNESCGEASNWWINTDQKIGDKNKKLENLRYEEKFKLII